MAHVANPIHALMICKDVWLPHLVLVCCSSSHCKSCCSVCDQLLFGSGHSSDNQWRERCPALSCMWLGDVMHDVGVMFI